MRGLIDDRSATLYATQMRVSAVGARVAEAETSAPRIAVANPERTTLALTGGQRFRRFFVRHFGVLPALAYNYYYLNSLKPVSAHISLPKTHMCASRFASLSLHLAVHSITVCGFARNTDANIQLMAVTRRPCRVRV